MGRLHRCGTLRRHFNPVLRLRSEPILEGCHKAITFTGYGLKKTRFFRIVLERLADLADGPVDSAFSIQKYILAPNPFDDLFPSHQFTAVLNQHQ